MTLDVFLTNLTWLGDRHACLHTAGRPELHLSEPLAFGGEPDKWTPEELLTGAVEACVLMAFLHFAKRDQIGLRRYNSHAEAHVEKTFEGLRFTRVNLTLDIGVASAEDVDKAAHAVELAEQHCPVRHVLTLPVNLRQTVTVDKSEAPHPRHVNPYDELTTF